jgi:hypothetical protein
MSGISFQPPICLASCFQNEQLQSALKMHMETSDAFRLVSATKSNSHSKNDFEISNLTRLSALHLLKEMADSGNG